MSATHAERARRIGVHAGHDTYKWWALSCTSLGMLLATINSGTLIIALPDLERSLHTSLLELVWVILVYMIASTVLVLSAGRLSDQFGRKKAYIGGFVLFALASLGAGFAGSGTELILWRIAQGVGGSFLFANAAAIVTDAFPREQLGLAMGTNTMVAAIGLVIGPVLGGALVSISWHWVFWFNVPFALAGSAWACADPPRGHGRSEDKSFDALGTITFLIGLTGLVFGISKGGLSGWGSPAVIGSLIAAAIFLPGFVFIESHVKSPMLDLSIFKNRLFSAASLAAFTNGLARFALMFVFVFYFQGVQGDSPIVAGIKLAPLALGMLISSPLAGIWADRRGSRGMAVAGMLVQAAGLALMTTLERDTAYIASGAYMFIVGIGSGMFNSPNTAAMMGTVPATPARHRGRRPGAGAEHRRGHLDRVRARGRHLVGAQERAVRGVQRPGQPHHERPARAVHVEHAHGAVVPGRDLAARRGDLRRSPEARDDPGRGDAIRARRHASRWRHEHHRDQAAADRRGRRAHRHDTAHDPLLRGDRPAARAPTTAPRASTARTARPTSSVCARSSGCATCSASRWTSSRRCSRPRPRGPRSDARLEHDGRPGQDQSGSSSRRSGTSAPSSSWCAAPPARARAARGGARRQAAPDPQATV